MALRGSYVGYGERRWSLCVMPPHTHVVLMIWLTYPPPLYLKVSTNVAIGLVGFNNIVWGRNHGKESIR